MSMLEFPTFEQMQAALSSPVAPVTSYREDDMEMSTDDMIREMFSMMREHHTEKESISTGSGVRARDSSYNSSTDTYDGLPATTLYNGAGL